MLKSATIRIDLARRRTNRGDDLLGRPVRAHDERHAEVRRNPGVAVDGLVDLRDDRAIESGLAHIAHDADYRASIGRASDRIFSREMKACQRFVDEECAWIQQTIPHRQVPPASNGHAQRGEIPWCDRAQLNLRTLVTWPAGDVEIADPAPVLQRHHLRETGRLHTWQLRNAIGDGEVIVVGNARRQVNRQHVVGDHSRIGAFETAELTDHAGDAERQHECQCNLDDDEPIAHPAEDQGARRTATRCFRDVLRVRPRDHHGRRQAKDHGDDDAHGEQEPERGPVEPDFVRSRDFGGADPDEKVERPARDDNTGHAAREREQQTLDEELADEPSRTRAERGTRDDFVRARGGASEEQVGDVGARCGKHQSDSAHQQPERLVNLAKHIVGERHQLNAKRPVGPGSGHIQPFLDGIELGGGRANA